MSEVNLGNQAQDYDLAQSIGSFQSKGQVADDREKS